MRRINLFVIALAVMTGLVMGGCGKDEEATEPVVHEVTSSDQKEEKPTPTPTPTPTPEPTPEVKEEPEPKEEVPAAIESFPTQTIYEEDGVVLSFEGITSNYSKMKLKFSNNNPDNKKASFSNLICSIDGVWDGGITGNPGISDLLAGDSKEFEVDLENIFVLRKKTYELLGAKDLPIEMASFFFEFRIGSDSEWNYHCCPIYSNDYKEGDLEQYYGEKLDTIAVRTDPSDEKYFDLYGKTDGNKAIVVYANQRGKGDFAPMMTNNWTMNDKGIGGSKFSVHIVGEGFISVQSFEVGQNYRVENEIPNDEPLNVGLYFEVFMDEYKYKIGTIE